MENIITKEYLQKLGFTNSDAELDNLCVVANKTLAKNFIDTLANDILDETDANKLIELGKENDNKKISEFLKEKVPDYEELLQLEVGVVVGELKDHVEGRA